MDDQKDDPKLATLFVLADRFSKKMSEVFVETYLEDIEEITAEEFEAAAKACRKTCEFMPMAPQILRAAGKSPSSIESKAQCALNNLEDALSKNKPSVAWPVTRHVADTLGGHQYLWGLTLDKFEFKRAQFIKAYIALAECEPEKLKQLEALPHVPNSRLSAPAAYQPLPGNITNGRLS